MMQCGRARREGCCRVEPAAVSLLHAVGARACMRMRASMCPSRRAAAVRLHARRPPARPGRPARPHAHHAQNDESRSVSRASIPCTDLNHWRLVSTMDTSAMGTCAGRMDCACGLAAEADRCMIWARGSRMHACAAAWRVALVLPPRTLKIMQHSFVKLSKRGSGSWWERAGEGGRV